MNSVHRMVAVYGAVVLLALAIGFGGISAAHADELGLGGTGVLIGQNGNAYVSGAIVTGTSTNGVTATTNLGGNIISWNVIASSTTKFGKLGKDLSALANVAVGDIVSFFGKLTGSGANLTVNATGLKDKTYTKAHATSTRAVKVGENHGMHLGWGKFFDLGAHGSLKVGAHGKDK